MEIRKEVENLTYAIDTGLSEAIAYLTDAGKRAEQAGFRRLSIDVSTESDYGGGSECAHIALYGWRDETVEECAERESREEMWRKNAERKEREQFEALKLKFGAGQ
jgi:L-alanine-DL-glutamate epimerase-like enolase superfamily enzyme